jgi:hypothetical protein
VKEGYVVVEGPILIVEVRDFNTLELISNSTISLLDFSHNEWQNITTSNGTALFTSSGSSFQYPLVNGTQYGVWASASGYSYVRKDVVITMNNQLEEIKLKNDQPALAEYSYSITFAELAETDRNLTGLEVDFPLIHNVGSSPILGNSIIQRKCLNCRR